MSGKDKGRNSLAVIRIVIRFLKFLIYKNIEAFALFSGFFSSDAEPYPWLQIKLGRERIVSSLTIVNRIDLFGSRLANLEIRSGYYELKNNSGTERILSNDLCGHFVGPGENGQIYNIKCDAPLPAKYVTIQIVPNITSLPHAEKRILQLNEVQINELII